MRARSCLGCCQATRERGGGAPFGDTGYLAIGNAFVVSLPATRNSVLLPLVGMSYDQVIVYHRWLGYLVLVTTTAHLGLTWWLWSLASSPANLLTLTFSQSNYIYGFFAWIAIVLMFLFALSYVRRRHFNVFYRVHYLFIAFYCLAAFHEPQYDPADRSERTRGSLTKH